jgi:hypothetical protein
MSEAAYRLRDGDMVLYVMPFEDASGKRVVYEQDALSFDTERHTVPAEQAHRLASRGCSVQLAETPAWCDPAAPRNVAVA